MTEKTDRDRPRHEVGTVADHAITYRFQYEFEKALALIRTESDPSTTENGLFALITDLASFIIQKGDKDAAKSARAELDLLDSENFSPKTKVDFEERDERYQLTSDSYQFSCYPKELPVMMDQLNRVLEKRTHRKMWVMLGRLKTLAFSQNILKANFTVDRSESND